MVAKIKEKMDKIVSEVLFYGFEKNGTPLHYPKSTFNFGDNSQEIRNYLRNRWACLKKDLFICYRVKTKSQDEFSTLLRKLEDNCFPYDTVYLKKTFCAVIYGMPSTSSDIFKLLDDGHYDYEIFLENTNLIALSKAIHEGMVYGANVQYFVPKAKKRLAGPPISLPYAIDPNDIPLNIIPIVSRSYWYDDDTTTIENYLGFLEYLADNDEVYIYNGIVRQKYVPKICKASQAMLQDNLQFLKEFKRANHVIVSRQENFGKTSRLIKPLQYKVFKNDEEYVLAKMTGELTSTHHLDLDEFRTTITRLYNAVEKLIIKSSKNGK